jgi:hypothetical protein
MSTAKAKALHKKTGRKDHVNLPHVGMGGKYSGMEFMRGAKGRATYLGMKRTRLHEEKQPTSFAKSVRRHQEK